MILLPNGWFIGADQYQYKVGNTTRVRKDKDTGEEKTDYVFDKYAVTLKGAFAIIHAAEVRNAVATKDMTFPEAKREIERITDKWVKVLEETMALPKEFIADEKVKESE